MGFCFQQKDGVCKKFAAMDPRPSGTPVRGQSVCHTGSTFGGMLPFVVLLPSAAGMYGDSPFLIVRLLFFGTNCYIWAH